VGVDFVTYQQAKVGGATEFTAQGRHDRFVSLAGRGATTSGEAEEADIDSSTESTRRQQKYEAAVASTDADFISN
jgi:hypothetical protein